MKKLVFIVFIQGMGVFAFGTWLLTFILFYYGHSLCEPTKWIALIEAVFVGIWTILSIIGFIYAFRMLRNGKAD